MLAAIGTATSVAGIVALLQGTAAGFVLIPPMTALAWFAAKAATRVLTSGVTVAPGGITTIGPLRTWHVPLSDAEMFVAEVRRGNNGQPTISLTRRAGSPVGIWALNRNGFVWNLKRMVADLEPIADDLNARLAAARARN